MSAADKIEAARALIEPLRATVLWGNANPDVMKAAEAIADLADLADAQAQENARLREALKALERASAEVSRRGAQTGPQWPKLSFALISARAALGDAP